VQRETDSVLLSDYAPSGVVVNSSLDIVYVRGRTGPYLEPASGRANLNILHMAREGLLPDLRTALQQAKQRNMRTRRAGVFVRQNGDYAEVEIEVVPLRGAAEGGGRQYFVIFHPATSPDSPGRTAKAVSAGKKGGKPPSSEVHRVKREFDTARRELAATREYLQSIIEEREAANEELKSANEEILSSNEELQSTNEELNTAKEELQSSNEELTTLNEELQNRDAESTRVKDDLVNLLTSIQIPIVMLGLDGRIRRFTPAAARLMNLLPTDVDRPIRDIRFDLDVPDLVTLGLESVDTGMPRTREVRESSGRWWLLRVHPYYSGERRIDGFVCTFTDIDSHKKAIEEEAARREFAREIFSTVPQVLLVLDKDLTIFSANNTFFEMFSTTAEATVGRNFCELGDGVWNIPDLRRALVAVIRRVRMSRDSKWSASSRSSVSGHSSSRRAGFVCRTGTLP
jgi:two-component system CheB/CheR fusion protein